MADGERFLAVTDKGNWLRGRIVYRGKVPIAIADAEMAPILGPDGRPLKSRGWYDTEALAVDDGVAYVGIERVNQIVRFDYRQGRPARARPPDRGAARHEDAAAQPEHRMPGDGAERQARSPAR